MKKIIIILISIIFITASKNAFAAKGKAAVYKVTMNEEHYVQAIAQEQHVMEKLQ